MKIIDSHVHVVQYINGFAARGELRPIGKGMAEYADGKTFQMFPEYMGDTGVTPEKIIEVMDENNVEKAILLQGNYLGFQNLYSFEAMKKYPARLQAACTIDPFWKNKDSVSKHLFEDLGFQIIKIEASNTSGLMSYHNKVSLCGKEMKYIYDQARKYNLIVVVDIGRPGNECYQVKELAKAAKKYFDVTFVVCHLTAPQTNQIDLLKTNLKKLNLPNVYFDLASLPNNTKEEYPFPEALEYIRTAISMVGSDKLLWGSDMPCALCKASYSEFINYIKDSDEISQSDKEKIFYKNANALFFKEFK